MKKIINGKLYDTETARQVGAYSYGEGRDFSAYGENLYRKRTGEYFLYGEGGPMTRYASHKGDNSWGWGEEISPLTLDAARQWAEKHMDADAYQAEFGPVAEDDTRVSMILSLDAATAERIRRRAREEGTSVSALIASLFPA